MNVVGVHFLECVQSQSSALRTAGFLALCKVLFISTLSATGILLLRKFGFCETVSRELIVTSPQMSLLSSVP